MEAALFSVKLTAEELVRLDGLCRPEVQVEVETAKVSMRLTSSGELAAPLAKLVADAVEEARREGRLIWRHVGISYCRVCSKSAGYAVYKSGRNRGRENRDKPRHMGAIEMGYRFVTMRGHVTLGACDECMSKALPTLKAELAAVQAQLPENLKTDDTKSFKRFENKRCKQCGWTGHDGQLGELPAIMGGHYRGQCPSCSAKNTFLGPMNVETAEGFTLVEKAAS